MINALVIGINLLSFNLGSYQGKRNFDSKGFAAKVIGWKDQSFTIPHLEDLWKDFIDEEEVIRKNHSRLTL